MLLREEVVFPWVFTSVRDGRSTYCWDDASPAACGEYEHDTPSGVWTYWWPDGTFQARGNFNSGVQDGLWLSYESRGYEVSEFPGHASAQSSWPKGAPRIESIRSGEYRAGRWVRDLVPEEREKLLREASEARTQCRCQLK